MKLCLFTILLVLSLASLSVPLWIYKAKRIENEINFITHNINNQLISRVHEAATFFSPINASAINLAKFINLSVEVHDFTGVESKVAPILFQALSSIPYLSQVSYSGLNGLFFAYYTKGDRLFALFSNYTFNLAESGTKKYYLQPANLGTGKVYGEAIRFHPSTIGSRWPKTTSDDTKVCSSLDIGWGSSHDYILSNIASIDGKGRISLGLKMKMLIDFITYDASFYNGSFILCTKDGLLLNQGVPNTSMILVDNQVSFQVSNFSEYHQVNVTTGNITCESDVTSILTILGKKYAMKCFPVELAGLQLFSILALPHDELPVLVGNTFTLFLVLIIVMTCFMIIISWIFGSLKSIAATREMHLCASLIKQMERTQQAERKSMNKSLAFANASHDIRASLAGMTELIEMSNSICPKIDVLGIDLHKNLLQMDACCKDLLGILNSILDTTKIEAGKMQLYEEEFDVEEMLEDVCDLFHPVGAKKSIDVILDPHDGSIMKCPLVKGDRGRLKQILCNLLNNAVKFTSDGHVVVRAWARKSSPRNEILPSHGHNSMGFLLGWFSKISKAYTESEAVLRIESNPDSMEFVFEVDDTGIGIPKEQHKCVFENYVQVKETSLSIEGTGLGLGIVQSLVRLMGGEIAIVDKEVGEKGTCFRFNIFLRPHNADISIDEPEVDVENQGDFILSDSFHLSISMTRNLSPKSEVSQVVLFIESKKRINLLQAFMERNGVKVHVVKKHLQLSSTLKKIVQKLNSSQCSYSSKTDSHSRSDGLVSCTSSAKEVPLSALDGIDNAVSPRSKSNPHGALFGVILIVIDTRLGPFTEISRAIAEFRKDLSSFYSSRVVWLNDPHSGDTNIPFLDQRILPSSDLLLSKPFHGSRLRQIMPLLPEFHSFLQLRKEKIKHNMNVEETGTSGIMKMANSMEGTSDIEAQKRQKPLKEKKILIVDDDIIGIKITNRIVSQLGATISSCKNGKEALDLVCERFKDRSHDEVSMNSLPFDCILMDCEMPIMNGIEATTRIRKEENLHGVRIPIIALTAHERDEMELMIEAGVDDILAKPLNKINLLKSISRFVC